MEKTVEALNNIQPLIIIGMMLTLWVVESFIPYFSLSSARRKQARRNMVIVAIAFVVNGLIGIYVNGLINYVADHRLGLLNWIHLPILVTIIAGMLLIDLWDYGFHLIQHYIPFFWRFHQVHHSDTELDVTSSIRFHPGDIFFQAVGWTFMFPLFGISGASFVIYFTFYLFLIFFQHANVKLPDWIDRYGSYVFSTPGWHKMHHAAERKLTDSHYGDVFTFWDRIFGTGGPIDIEHIDFGIEYFRDQKDQTVKSLLLHPFRPLPYQKINQEQKEAKEVLKKVTA